jgi:hypothetical protein
MRYQKDDYENERRYLYSALVASAQSELTEDLRLTHKAQLQLCNDNRDKIAFLKLFRDHCSKNATQSIITQKKNWESLRQKGNESALKFLNRFETALTRSGQRPTDKAIVYQLYESLYIELVQCTMIQVLPILLAMVAFKKRLDP